MKLQELIQEFTDCHDKQQLDYLRSEIDRHTTEHIMRCFDATSPDKKPADTKITLLRCNNLIPEPQIGAIVSKYQGLHSVPSYGSLR